VKLTEKEQIIFDRQKSNLPSEYEKDTAGFLTYEIIKVNAIELAIQETYTEALQSKLNPENMTLEELMIEARTRRGIIRKEATPAQVVLTVTGQGTVNEGDLFSTLNKVLFKANETIVINLIGTVKAECLEAGTIGMVGTESIIQIPVTLEGITGVTNLEASYDGFEAESRESLLERYLDDVRKPATSNNIYHFEKWAREVAGVGRAKVFPTWNGNNSVKVVILNDNMLPASVNLVSDTQTYIDPIDVSKWGKGYGQAALGSYCTIAAGTQKTCNVVATITKSANYTTEQIRLAIVEAITKYFQEIAFHETINYVSYAKISAIIVNIEGVLDVSSLTLNGTTANIILASEEVAVLGSVTI